MKKILLSIFLVLTLFIITGCGKESINEEESKKDVTEVKVDKYVIKLNSNTSFNDISFKYPLSAQTMNVGTYYLMDYLDNGEFIFRIAMYKFENKTINEAMETNKVISKGIKTINGREWNVYEGKTDDNKNLLNYAYRYNKDTYTITFIYDKDLSNFIDEFMNNVKFN